MSKFIAMIAVTTLLTGTAQSLLAQDEPSSESAISPGDLRIQQEEFVNNLKHKLNHYVERLEQVDRTKLIVQSAPFAALLPQFHPSTPGIIAFRNAPLVAAQYQRLMREWNRYQLLVSLESAKQLALNLIQPPEVFAVAAPLVNGAKPLMQVLGQIQLPNAKISMESFNQFLHDFQKYQSLQAAGSVVQQD